MVFCAQMDDSCAWHVFLDDVAGAFEVFDHAEDFSDDLFQRGFRETIVGYVSARGYYYVVIFSSQNENAAINQRNRFRSAAGLSDIWVLKVNE